VAPGVDRGNLVCATGAAHCSVSLGRVLVVEIAEEWLQFLTLLRVVVVLCFANHSISADRHVMAASKLLGAAAACVILLSFAAGHRKSY